MTGTEQKPPWLDGYTKRAVNTLRAKFLMDFALLHDCHSHLDVGANVAPYADFSRAMGLRSVRCDVKSYTDDTIVGMLPSLPFKDKAFDIVTCFEVLEHMREPKRSIEELCRVSKKVIIISVPEEKSNNSLADPTHISFFSCKDLRDLRVDGWRQRIYGENNRHTFIKGISYGFPWLFSEAFIVVYASLKVKLPN